MTIAEITKDVRSALCNISTIDGRVYPIIAPEGASYPFVTYERASVDYLSTKDGNLLASATFEVHIVTATYLEGLNMLDTTINLLTHMVSDFGNTYQVRIDGTTEQWVDNAYIQNLTITL